MIPKPDARTKGRVLAVDDEENIRAVIAATLEGVGFQVLEAGSAEEALEILKDENVDVVISDIRMPGMDGLKFLHRVKQEQPGLRFLMITAHGSLDMAVQALRFGASDFLTKPFENSELRAVVTRLWEEGKIRNPVFLEDTEKAKPLIGIVGNSPAFAACIERAKKAAVTESTVLITGESGTGKEVMAKCIHDLSARGDKPFVAVNCGAIPDNLVESELFGHEKGAFTGAMSAKPGKFLLADGGTLFLDEIGELPLPMQVKLLRALQERSIEPVGSSAPKRVDFRLLAATNRNLREEVAAGRFREDLFFRLNVIPMELPALRERGEDILQLSRYFLDYFNTRYGCSHALTPAHEKALLSHAWPGNVRELANTVERAVVLAGPEGLEFQFEPAAGEERDGMGVAESPAADSSLATKDNPGGIELRTRRQETERATILKALEQNRWNKTQTAGALGISRRSLLYKIKEYGIS